MTKAKHIIKSNNLIDCSYRLTLNEQRFVNMACNKLTPIFVDKNLSISELQELARANVFGEIEIGIPEYKKEFGVNSNNIYTEIESIANSLYEKEIIYFDEDDNLVRKRWVITCKFNKSTKKVTMKFHPDLIMDLMIFKGRYTKLNYSFLTTIKSFYAGRLYELLRQYLSIGSRTFDVQEIRFKFNLLDGEYPRYANLKQKILKPSIDWINNNSDILIEMLEIKVGRTVTRLKFSIRPSGRNANKDITKSVIKANQMNMDKELDNQTAYYKIRAIVDIDLSAGDIENICDSAVNGLKYNELGNIKVLDYIKSKWELTCRYSKGKKDFNPIGFLLKALRENWCVKDVSVSNNNFTSERQYNYDAIESILTGEAEYRGDEICFFE